MLYPDRNKLGDKKLQGEVKESQNTASKPSKNID